MSDRSNDLVYVLVDLGVEVNKIQSDEINGRCPVHHLTKGRESTRYSWYLNSESGLWYCFSCGARGNLPMLVSQLSPDPSALWNVQTHLINSGLQRLTAVEEEVREVYEPVNWSNYVKFDPMPDRLLNVRKLDPEMASRYGIRWDTEKKATVIPIVSPVGELWGWQLKKHGWVRNYPEGIHKGDTLFGIERAHADTGLLLESPLDVVRFHSVYAGSDISAVASFGANVSDRQVSLLSDRFDGLIIAFDNDAAGRMETKRLRRKLSSFRNGVRYWKYDTDDKDLGDMSDYTIIHGLKHLTAVYV